jgi:hypothetical protein
MQTGKASSIPGGFFFATMRPPARFRNYYRDPLSHHQHRYRWLF